MFLLKILGWAVGGLLSLILLLSLPSLRLYLSAEGGEFQVTLRYLFLSFRVYPLSDKPQKAKKKKAGKKPSRPEKPKKIPAEKEKVSPFKLLEQYKPFLYKAKRILRSLCKRMVIYKVKARVRISGQDAHKTALKYTHSVALVAVLSELLGWAFTLKKPDVLIAPDFLRDKSAYHISLRLRFRPIFAMLAGIRLLLAYLGASKRRPKQNNTTDKGGQKYESAASHR